MTVRPPSAKRFHKLADEIRRGEIYDYGLLYLCEDNPYYQAQLDDLLRAPERQMAYEAEQTAKAAAEASRRLRRALLDTCRAYRDTRVSRNYLHRNRRYLRRLRLQKNERDKQKLWDRFLISVLEYRTLVALDCIDRRHAAWQTNVIWSSSPYQQTTEYPFGSKCSVELIRDPNWVDVKAPEPPTQISVERTLKQRLLATERALEEMVYKVQYGIERPKQVTVTTTDSDGKRRTHTPHAANPSISPLTLGAGMGPEQCDQVSQAESDQTYLQRQR